MKNIKLFGVKQNFAIKIKRTDKIIRTLLLQEVEKGIKKSKQIEFKKRINYIFDLFYEREYHEIWLYIKNNETTPLDVIGWDETHIKPLKQYQEVNYNILNGIILSRNFKLNKL